MKPREITIPIKLKVTVEEETSGKWVVVGTHIGAVPAVFGFFSSYDDADFKRAELQQARMGNNYYVLEVQE